MTKNSPNKTGGSGADAPRGDPAAQAVASLRGYAYQLYASGLAWLELKPSEVLHLEVAKDYAVAAGRSLRAVEVKDTAASTVTINSEDVRETLDGFIDLVERNPQKAIHLRFLSTSTIGTEKSKDHRANGEPTLHYWRRAAAGADVEALREVLARIQLTPRVRAFIDARDNDALRSDFLRRIHWDCGAQVLDGVVSELQSGLARYAADKLGAHLTPKETLGAVVLQTVLATVVSENRSLTGADLHAAITAATMLSVPREEFETLVRTFAKKMGEGDSATIEATTPRVLEAESNIPLPVFLAERKGLIDNISKHTRAHGVTFITGSSGFGKTVLARLTARSIDPDWSLIDLRDLSASEVVQRLEAALGQLGGHLRGGVILDDLNEIEDQTARRAFLRFWEAVKRRDELCLITSYREPSVRVLTELALDKSAVIPVPDLTEEEVTEIVVRSGADGKKWGKLVHIAGAFGHPLLVQAEIMGLRSRSWSNDEYKRLYALKESDDVAAERLKTRQRLVAAVPDQARSLLYRTSLLIGRFDRKLVLALGQAEPPIAQAGAGLDLLIGPWVEHAVAEGLRLSPLLQGAGEEVLSAAEVEAFSRVAADHVFSQKKVDIIQANPAFLYALRGRAEGTLTKIAYSIVTVNEKTRKMLSEWMTGLKYHRTDKLIFEDNNFLSVMLRLAQFTLVSESKKKKSIRECWSALQRELQLVAEGEARDHLEFIVLTKALINQPAAGMLPDWVWLIVRFRELMETDPARKATFTAVKPPTGHAFGQTVIGTSFILQCMGIESVADLKEAFDQLDALTPEARAELFVDVERMPRDYGLIVNRSWLSESQKKSANWNESEKLYLGMAEQAQRWGIKALALRCHVARAVVIDEYLNKPDAALNALEDAKQALGESSVLSRAIAKIHYRKHNYAVVLKLLRECIPTAEIDEPIERTYMLREAAISAAHSGDWLSARQWFTDASAEAAKVKSPTMKVMAIGLKGDGALAAHKSGDLADAVTGLEKCLDDLRAIEPSSSITAGYCHRLIRHAVLWLFQEATNTPLHVHDEPTAMLPGMCSNPDPTDLADMPLGSAGYAYYMLANIEALKGLSTGVEERLQARQGSRVVPGMELGLRKAHLDWDIVNSDAVRFARDVQRMVDGQNWLDENREVMLSADPQKPTYGQIPALTPQESSKQSVVYFAEDSFLAFGIFAAINGRGDALAELSKLMSSYPPQYAGSALVTAMTKGAKNGPRMEEFVANAVFQAVGEELTPDILFIVCTRFLQKTKEGSFGQLLTPLIIGWAKMKWHYAVEHQTFHLRNPMSTVPPILEALIALDGSLASFGRLILAIEPAVHLQLPQTFRDSLVSS